MDDEHKIHDIEVSDIHLSPSNVRHLDAPVDEGIEELAASIKKLGLLQPIVLLGNLDSRKPYQLIAGQRRFLAHKYLKAETIKAVFAGNLDKTDIILRSLIENVQRVELDYTDTSDAITYLFKHFDKNDRKVAQATGLSLRKVREYVSIDALASTKMKEQIRKKQITAIDVKRALRAANNNITKAERIVDLIIEVKPTPDQKRRIPDYGTKLENASAEKILEEAMKVHVQRSIVLNLSEAVREGLARATAKLKVEPDELAAKVLQDWLQTQGFTKA
jgi:ParB family chromosome partitioning protein